MRRSPHFCGPSNISARSKGRDTRWRDRNTKKRPANGTGSPSTGLFWKRCAEPCLRAPAQAGVSSATSLRRRRHQGATTGATPMAPMQARWRIHPRPPLRLQPRQGNGATSPVTCSQRRRRNSVNRANALLFCRWLSVADHSTVYSFVMINAGLLGSTKLGSSARTAAYSGVGSDSRRASVLSAHTSATPS